MAGAGGGVRRGICCPLNTRAHEGYGENYHMAGRANTNPRRKGEQPEQHMLNLCTEVFETEPQRLVSLLDLDLGSSDVRYCSEGELGAILRHQLAAPLAADLANPRCVMVLAGRAGDAMTFGQLLQAPCPCLELLHGVKEFAKLHLAQSRRLLPYEVARVLYYASVLVARLRCGERISSVSDARLREGLEWAREQPWLERWLAELFGEGEERLGSGSV
jgi:hypothetical protein